MITNPQTYFPRVVQFSKKMVGGQFFGPGSDKKWHCTEFAILGQFCSHCGDFKCTIFDCGGPSVSRNSKLAQLFLSWTICTNCAISPNPPFGRGIHSVCFRMLPMLIWFITPGRYLTFLRLWNVRLSENPLTICVNDEFHLTQSCF